MYKKIFLCFIFLCISLFNLLYGANAPFVVVIDAGHGGRDAGAVRGSYKEKNINLGVALALGELITANMRNVKVVYTRKSDVFVDLHRRSDIANKAKANLFISIHTNSTASKVTTAAGADTYILGLARSNENLEVAKRENSVILLEDNYNTMYEGFDPNSPESNILFEFMTNKNLDQSLELATHVQQGFASVAKRVNRGIAQAGFLVLRESGMPSVLIELGFINNPTEAKFLASKSGQQKMAEAIYSGFKKYKANFDKHQGIVDAKVSRTNTSSNAAVQKQTQPSSSPMSNGFEYRVQFLTSPSKYEANSKAFKGLSPVKSYKENGTYKYTYGSVSTEAQAVKLMRQVRQKFKDAFVVKFKDGVRQR